MGTTFSSGRWVPDYTNQILYRDTSVTPTTVDLVRTLYSDAMSLFDDAAQMDDPVPLSAQTPTEFSIINQWFIPDESTKYLYGGAIATVGYSSGTTHYIRQIAYNPSTDFVASDVGKTITGTTTTDSGTIVAFDTVRQIVWIRPDDPSPGGDEFDNGTENYTVGSSTAAGAFTAVSQTGEALYANIYGIGTIAANTREYVYQGGSKITDWPAGIGLNADGHIDVLIKVREAGTLIDDGYLIVYARQGGKLYDHFETDVSAGGRNPIPLATGGDLNDGVGHHSLNFNSGGGTGTFATGDLIYVSGDTETAGVVASTTDAGGATGSIDYFLVRSLAQFANLDAITNGSRTASVNGAPTDLDPVNDSDITFTFGAFTRDINNGNGARPYSISVDPNSKSFARVYRRGKYLLRRGSVTAINGENGEEYRGASLQIEYNTQTGSFVEGETVYDTTTGASGVVVADHDDGATGDLILKNVRGTFTGGNIVGDAASGPTDFATIVSTRAISTPKSAPLGTFAGGTWFGPPGGAPVLANIASGEANSYQLTDDDGSPQTPPQQVSVTVNGLSAGDRVAVFRLTGAGGTIVKNEYTSHATNNVQGDATFDVQSSVSSEAPATAGWIRVVYDPDLEDRYAYDSYSGVTFTLTSHASWTGRTVTTGDTAGLTLTDSGATFVTSGVKPGMMVRNTTDGSIGTVASVTSETELVLEQRLSGGTEDDFDVSDGYEINTLVRTYDGSDTVYVPFIDEVATTTEISRTIVYSSTINVLVRVRQGGAIYPFEAANTIGANGMTQGAVRTTDTIYA